jgi:tetraacyldisaccharide 4'-kinase
MPSPWQALYTAAHRLRWRWYETRARHLPRPVVSVGNLHWGGTGKTPLTAAVAAHLRDGGRQVAILSRGYGRESARDGQDVVVVSRGQGPLVGPSTAGDEPVLLAGSLPGVAVVVGADRHRAGEHALHRLDPPPDVFVLDDGFSHLSLARDLDLLVLPAEDPFGGGKLPPSGRLREPLPASRRADAVLVTGAADEFRAGLGSQAAQVLRAHGFRGRGFDAPTHAEPPRALDGSPLPAGARVLLVSAIARPSRFAASAAAAGLEIVGEIRFQDHHPYPEESLELIGRELAARNADWVLATSKDRVKLQGRLELPLAELPIRAEPEPAFWGWLEERLEALG